MVLSVSLIVDGQDEWVGMTLVGIAIGHGIGVVGDRVG